MGIAIASLLKQKSDLIFLDLQLPDAPGDQVYKTPKHIDPDLKVIVITGYPDGEVVDRILRISPLTVWKAPGAGLKHVAMKTMETVQIVVEDRDAPRSRRHCPPASPLRWRICWKSRASDRRQLRRSTKSSTDTSQRSKQSVSLCLRSDHLAGDQRPFLIPGQRTPMKHSSTLPECKVEA